MATKVPTADEAKQQAITATTAGVEAELAGLLKSNYEIIRLKYGTRDYASEITEAQRKGNTPKLKAIDDDFRKMAKDAIDQRRFTAPSKGGNPVTISLEDLNRDLQALPEGNAFLAEHGVKKLGDMVPTRPQVAAIANAVGDAAYENFSRLSFTGVQNLVMGAVASNATAANNMKASVKSKLEALRSDTAMQPLLTPGPAGTVSQISTAAHDTVMNPDAPAADRLAATPIKPQSEAIRQAIGEGIYTATFAAAQQGINDEIEKKYKEAGWMGSIAKAIGPDMANMLIAVINFFITAFGGKGYDYIPNENETHNAANVIAQSVSDVFTGKTPPKTKEAAGKAVHDAVKAALEKEGKENFPSFSPAQLEEMAIKAGQGAAEQFEAIPGNKKSSEAMDKAKQQAANQHYQPAEIPGYSKPATQGFTPREPLGHNIS